MIDLLRRGSNWLRSEATAAVMGLQMVRWRQVLNGAQRCVRVRVAKNEVAVEGRSFPLGSGEGEREGIWEI